MNVCSLKVIVLLCPQEVSLGVGENIPVLIQFDPSYRDDFVTRTAESQLEVSFKEHPQKVSNVVSSTQLIIHVQAICFSGNEY